MPSNYQYNSGNSAQPVKLADALAPLKKVPQYLLGGLILVGLWTLYYTVPADSVALVSRFGVVQPVAGPGLHFKLPFGIDQVEMVPTLRQMKQEFGYGTGAATYAFQSTSEREQALERNLVTGDLNSVQVEWVVQFTISDPLSFVFQVRNSDETLRDASESVMREVVGDRTVDEVITVGRHDIEVESKVKLQELTNHFGLGVTINQIQLINVDPPLAVQSAFSEVTQSQQEREQAVNVANGEYNKVVPRARGEADQKIGEAQGYALKRVNEAEGDASHFNAIYKEYSKSPEVTRKRMYLESMGKVLPLLNRPYILDPSVPSILPTLALPSGSTGGDVARPPAAGSSASRNTQSPPSVPRPQQNYLPANR